MSKQLLVLAGALPGVFFNDGCQLLKDSTMKQYFFVILFSFFMYGSADAGGLLRVHPTNPIYFTDNSGKAIYLGGHQIFADLQDKVGGGLLGGQYVGNQRILDWSWYLEFIKSRNINYIRNWTEFNLGPSPAGSLPLPYERVQGAGNAIDGLPKVDLNLFNQLFFDRMRSRAIELGKNGIYISLMLFDVYGFSNFGGEMGASLFNPNNNINGINADTNGDGWGVEFFMSPSSQIRNLQHEYIKKVIDTVNDLDNVIFEIGNEVGSLSWQTGIINFIRHYESSKPKQHLILFSPGGLNGARSYTGISQSEILSTHANIFAVSSGWGDYLNNPPVNTQSTPGILDRDHVDATAGPFPMLPWKAFTRGYHFSLYDQPFEQPEMENSEWDLVRKNIGAAVEFANNKFSDLAKMKPNGNLSSTQYVLANPNNEYLIFQPDNGSFTLALEAGNYKYEWFNPNTAHTAQTGPIDLSTGTNTLTPPFSGSAVLYLKKAAATSSPLSCNNLWTSSFDVPSSFGASVNFFSSANELLIQAYCSSEGVHVSVGNGSNTQYIYRTGYVWSNNTWTSFNYSGASFSADGNWIIGHASNSFSSLDLTQTQSALAYICDWNGTLWHCGCHDSGCAVNHWNLQQFKE